MQAEVVGETQTRAEARTERAGRGETVAQRRGHIGNARAVVDRGDLHDPGLRTSLPQHRRRHDVDEDLTPLGMLEQIRGELGRDQRGGRGAPLVETGQRGRALRGDPCVAHPRRVAHRDVPHAWHQASSRGRGGWATQQVTRTVVPSPGVLSMWKSCTRRRAPLSPIPSPPPEV